VLVGLKIIIIIINIQAGHIFQPVAVESMRRVEFGATENARHENTGRSKMQGWKMRDMNLRHQNARVENARHESAAPDCTGGKCET